jgi:hypothetical protein
VALNTEAQRGEAATKRLTTVAPKKFVKPQMNADERRCIEVNAAKSPGSSHYHRCSFANLARMARRARRCRISLGASAFIGVHLWLKPPHNEKSSQDAKKFEVSSTEAQTLHREE